MPELYPNFRCEFGANIHLGNHFFANYDCVILDGAPVTIGNHVLFGPKVGLFTSNQQGDCVAKPITIGDNCWSAANVSVTPGVTIGSNTIIGAGSVVTHDILANVIAVGSPCQVLRPITEEDRTGFAPTNPLFK